MNKREFIAWLEGIPGDPAVLTWCPEEDEWMPVTGGTHDEDAVRLYTYVEDEEYSEEQEEKHGAGSTEQP